MDTAACPGPTGGLVTATAARWPGLAGAAIKSPAGGMPGGIWRRPAQELARRELARRMYQESYTARFWHWVGRILGSLLHDGGRLPGGWWSSVALLVTLVLVIAVVVFWIRPAGAVRRRPGAVLTGSPASAQDHRELAASLAAAGDYGPAIIERMRAIAVTVEDRRILPAQPGRTADELATQTGLALPQVAAQLTVGARLFDDVMYGGRAATMAGYELITRLDGAVQAAAPTAREQAVPAATGAGPA